MAANFGNVYLLSTLPLNGNFTPFETRWNVYTAVVVLGIKKVSCCFVKVYIEFFSDSFNEPTTFTCLFCLAKRPNFALNVNKQFS